jgi:serine/threonine protein phosphatase PrpC
VHHTCLLLLKGPCVGNPDMYIDTDNLSTIHLQDFVGLIKTITENLHQDEVLEIITAAFRNAFLLTDAALIEQCRELNHHYTASTGVTAFFFKNILTISHVGDSRACIARVSPDGGTLECELLTACHKANQPQELRRIKSQGGSLVYLHGDKPYLRWGES